jgi:hypothetical protein
VSAHIRDLSAQGVGRRALADASDVNEHTLSFIKRGRRQKIRATTAARILGTDAGARADSALVSPRRTRLLIAELVRSGYTHLWIARQLGYKSGGLQFHHKRITARNASRVERLYLLIQAGKVARA